MSIFICVFFNAKSFHDLLGQTEIGLQKKPLEIIYIYKKPAGTNGPVFPCPHTQDPESRSFALSARKFLSNCTIREILRRKSKTI